MTPQTAAALRALVSEIGKTVFRQREQGMREMPDLLESYASRIAATLPRPDCNRCGKKFVKHDEWSQLNSERCRTCGLATQPVVPRVVPDALLNAAVDAYSNSMAARTMSANTWPDVHAMRAALAAVLTQEGAGIKSSVPEFPDNSAAPAEPRAAEGAGTGIKSAFICQAKFSKGEVCTHPLCQCYANPPTAAAAVLAGGDAVAGIRLRDGKYIFWWSTDYFDAHPPHEWTDLFAAPAPRGGVTEAKSLRAALSEFADIHCSVEVCEKVLEMAASYAPPAAQAQDAGPMARHIKQALAEFADIHMSEQVCDEVLKLARALAAKEAK